jgi:hypothetical protein
MCISSTIVFTYTCMLTSSYQCLFEVLWTFLRGCTIIANLIVAQRSKALHLSVRGIPTDPGLFPAVLASPIGWYTIGPASSVLGWCSPPL